MEFLVARIARGLAARKLFTEKSPGVLKEAVRKTLALEIEKERALDEEARRLMDAARADIARGAIDGNELYRKIRKKLAEQKGIVL
jgi:hypothetical protein